MDIDSLEYFDNDYLVIDRVMDLLSKDFEKYYDMLYDIEMERDVYGWGYVDLAIVKFGYNVVNGICIEVALGIECIYFKLVVVI